MTKPKIIGLMGFMRSGKSTLASMLDHYGYKRYRFAAGLKAMLRSLGLTEAQVDGDQKEVPCELLGGKTPRHAMLTLGTEWGRHLIHGDLWVRALMLQIINEPFVVIDDVRFPNEAEAIWQRGGVIWQMTRVEAGLNSDHPSEAGQLAITPNLIIENNGDLADLDTTLRFLLGSTR